MNADNFDLKALLKMAHSPIRNYAIPGLTSSLIGSPSAAGTVRLFTCDREHQEPITPHSHRFNFQCWVLRGSVRNRVWTVAADWDETADHFQRSELQYQGAAGNYNLRAKEIGRWKHRDEVYAAGQCYSMRAHEIHSIYFSRDSAVLLFEGVSEKETSMVLEPYVNGQVIPTFKVEPWMFQRKEAA